MALPVVDDWFARQQLTDGITLFTEPHIDPWLQPNTWHVRGRDQDLLIDTGIESCGVEFVTPWEKIAGATAGGLALWILRP